MDHADLYRRFSRPTPAWFADSGLGIFIHWGAYSVPAWAEPIGALGTFDDMSYWFAHNPYAEWYANTIRIEDTPARRHHREVWGDAPYDDFLDAWRAEEFDPDDWMDLFRRAGARYVVPTTKHHDGITLWDAPGTGERNTVHRGPRRDLVADLARATRAGGLRFGVYYSSGLDWHAAPMDPIRDTENTFIPHRPHDEDYARYVAAHVDDLIARYRPDVLWGDIGHPEAGQGDAEYGFARILDRFYAAAPEGVVNDRWGRTHWDFRTAEYSDGEQDTDGSMWQLTRGIGYSFGYNQVEGPESYLSAREVVKLLVDTVSRGGNLLLNVGPEASGRLPGPQRAALEGLATWQASHGEAVHAVRPVPGATASQEPWVRWTANDQAVFAIVDAEGPVRLAGPDGVRTVDLPDLSPEGPHVVRFARVRGDG